MNLVRFAYLPDCTLGWLEAGQLTLATIERPWIPSPHHRGGKNRESCIPDGDYEMRRHSGPDFTDVFALSNPALDVHYLEQPRADQAGRWAILLHNGNFAHSVIGCIAVGIAHVRMADPRGGPRELPAVSSSVMALNRLRRFLLDHYPLPRLSIRPTAGTAELAGGGAP